MSDEQQQDGRQLTTKPPEQQRQLARPGFAFLPKSWEELYAYAKEISTTDFVPNALRGKPGAVLAAWQTGSEVGLPPMASLTSIAIINGRPSIHSDGYWALVVNHPMCEWFKETPPDEALAQGFGECTIKRRGNPHLITRRFTMAEAKAANLVGKDNWKNYPGDMLQNRARHRAGTDAIPEATQGVLPADVARDLPPIEIEVEAEKPKQIAMPKLKEKADAKKPQDPSDQTPPQRDSGGGADQVDNPGVESSKGEAGEGVAGATTGTSEAQAEKEKPRATKARKETPEPIAGGDDAAPMAEPWKDTKLDLADRIQLWIDQAPDEEFRAAMNFFNTHLNQIKDTRRQVSLCKQYDARKRGE